MPLHYSPRLKVTLLAIAITLTPIGVPHAIAKQEPMSAVISITVPAGPLDEALNTLASLSGLAMTYSPDLVKGLSTKGLQGDLKISEALSQLLVGTGVGYRFVNDSTVVLHKQKENNSAGEHKVNQLGTVSISDTYTMNESIDTSTGLGLTLRETPQSVSVFTSQRIIDQNISTIADVVQHAPGVSVNEIDDVRNTFKSRGFEINSYQVDGVPLGYTLAGGAGETILDTSIYERIEIVRGATGLMTGVGDPAASINLVRKHADSKELKGFVNFSHSSWDTFHIATDTASALNDSGSIRARTVAKYEEGESNVNRYEEEKLVLYGIVEVDLSENTILGMGASYQNVKRTAPAWGALPAWYTDGSETDFSRSQTSSADWSFWDTKNQNIFVTLSHDFSNDWVFTANYNWLKNAQQTEILYLFGTLDRDTGIGLSSFPYSDDGNNTQNSLDLQLKGYYNLLGREHEFVVGGLYSKQDYENNTYATLSFPAGFSYYDIQNGSFPYPGFSDSGSRAVDMNTKQTAIYASTRLNLTNAAKVIVGGRVSTWERDGFDFGPEFDYGDENVFIPYIGALYDIADNHTIYTSYTEIYRPQVEQDVDDNYLDSVEGKNIEIGLKSAFFDNTLQTSLAIFRTTQDNLAQEDVIVAPNDQRYKEAEGPTSKGLELELVGKLNDNWNISFSYTDFEIEDANGNDINTDHPRSLAKLFTTYNVGGTLSGLTLGAGLYWQDEIYSDTTNPVTSEPFKLQQDDYTLVNLMARYKITERLSLQANIDNVTDEKYYSQVGFFQQYRYGEARNYSLNLNYAF